MCDSGVWLNLTEQRAQGLHGVAGALVFRNARDRRAIGGGTWLGKSQRGVSCTRSRARRCADAASVKRRCPPRRAGGRRCRSARTRAVLDFAHAAQAILDRVQMLSSSFGATPVHGHDGVSRTLLIEMAVRRLAFAWLDTSTICRVPGIMHSWPIRVLVTGNLALALLARLRHSAAFTL